MPIFMDRHDVSKEVTAEKVADLHQLDLKIQDKFNCKGLTYWFDDKRKTAFCLVDAPNKAAIKAMHDYAHGAVPHKIIEVDGSLVESFLGRIEDPEKSQKTELNIINDPAFRAIMMIRQKRISLKSASEKQASSAIEKQNIRIVEITGKFKGRMVKQKPECFLISFDSITNALLCALEIKTLDKPGKNSNPFTELNIGLSAGVPVSEKEGFFEETIEMAEWLCNIVKGQIAVSSEVKDLYESENLNVFPDSKYVNALHSSDEKFLSDLMVYIEREWNNSSLNVEDFSKNLGCSKSQFYRKMIYLTGKSPNGFLKEYRLYKALELLDKKNDNISEVAFETGFNTPAYFSKCFQNTFGIRPSLYLKY